MHRERLASEDDMLVDMGSDQTSLHNPYNGGYYPVGMSFKEANQLMMDDPEKFKNTVQERLFLMTRLTSEIFLIVVFNLVVLTIIFFAKLVGSQRENAYIFTSIVNT